MQTTLDIQFFVLTSIPVGAAAVTPLSSALARQENAELNDELLLAALADHAAQLSRECPEAVFPTGGVLIDLQSPVDCL